MKQKTKEVVVVTGSGAGCLLVAAGLIAWLVVLPTVGLLCLGGWLK